MPDNVTLAERRATLLQAAAKVGRNVTLILDPDLLLDQTVDIICDEFGFYYAGVFLIDETGEWAVLCAGRGEAGATMIAAGHKLKVDGHSMIGASTGQRKALIALDVGEEPVHFKNPHLPNTRSEMALPLIVGDQVIGALTVQSTEEAAFTNDDITVLQTMADQLAIAIRNADLHLENRRLLARAERRARLLSAASQVGRDVTSILDMNDLLNKTVDIICDAYGFYYAGVFLVDEAGEWAVLRAGRGEAGATMIANAHRLAIGGHSMIGTCIERKQARIALDVGEEPVHFKNPNLPHTRSEMALPLIVADRAIGAVTVQSVEEAAFSDDDVTSLQAMADQLAIAINNARLLKELEAAHAELVRTKTFEALATSTLSAIHWIGNKALPISASVGLLRGDLESLSAADPDLVESMLEDLATIEDSSRLIVSVQEHLIGPAREEKPRPAMVDDVIKDTAVAMGIPPGMVSYAVAPDLPLAVADTTQLGRAFGYALKNAVEAMEGMEGQRINIEVTPAGDERFIAVCIADTGPGIPDENLEKIWAAFYTTKGAKHAGLGLSACYQILKQAEGKISASNVPGGGAMFELLIPVFDGILPPAVLPAGKSILLIDDDDAWSSFVEVTLTDANSTVIRSADGQADLDVFELILVDNALEAADVRTVLKRLRAAGAGDKTVVVASSLRVERTMELMPFGVRDVVLKPYAPAALAELVR
ncbi:MAG: GAF domain-containing protein [Chloroflexota bacterium]|nr:GAF domain-containing protein [Chloroflexota bacterium]